MRSLIEWVASRRHYRRRRLWRVNFKGSNIQIQSTQDTLTTLESRLKHGLPTCYLRFGDGEINLINGKKHRDQKSSRQLERDLFKAFSLTGAGMMKALPLNSERFGLELGMEPGVHARPDHEAETLLSGCFEYFIGQPVWSAVALHYAIAFTPDSAVSYLHALRERRPIFVAGKHNDTPEVKEVLNYRKFIDVPSQDAYDSADRILPILMSAILEDGEDFPCVVFSCGPLANVLAEKLWNSREISEIYISDLGSVMDVFSGRDGWTWVKRANIDRSRREQLIREISSR